jgi:hypothetical protein
MDIEKAIASLLENQARFAEDMNRLKQCQIDAEERHARDVARTQAEIVRTHEELAALRAELRRAVRLSVEEVRRERLRRQEMHAEISSSIAGLSASHAKLSASIADLRAMQAVTEEKVQRLIDHLDGRP